METTATRHDRHGEWPQARSVEEFRHNLAAVRARIAAACGRAGRDPATVRLLPVSKTVDERRIRAAHAAGCRWFGENKVQEARRKSEATADLAGLAWSVIGHLQTNKAGELASFASEFQALDSVRVAAALDRRLQAEGRGLDVFVQVNVSGEESKHGLAPDAVAPFLRELPAFTALRVRGLMTLALLSDDAWRVRDCFVSLRTLRDRLRQEAPAGVALGELSMGMSGDYEIAVEEGATVVRVGQAIFGSR
jgi:pyridoxal phosphate enzyme (YggS family)